MDIDPPKTNTPASREQDKEVKTPAPAPAPAPAPETAPAPVFATSLGKDDEELVEADVDLYAEPP